MPLILEKLFRAAAILLLLPHWDSLYDDNQYAIILYDTFVIGILAIIGTFNFRTFVLLGYKPIKNDIIFQSLFIILLALVLYFIKNQFWYLICFIPAVQYSYYIEKEKPSLYYISTIVTVSLGYLFTRNNILYFPLILIPNSLIGIIYFIKNKFKKDITYIYKQKSLLKYSLPLVINSLLVVMYTKIDVFLVKFINTDAVFNGNYFSTIRVVDHLIMVPVVYISYSLRKWTSDSNISILYDYRLIISGSIIVSIFSILIMSIVSDFIRIEHRAYLLYSIIIPIITINTIRNNILLIKEENWNVSKFSVFSIILNILFSLTMYPVFGVYAVVYGTLLAQVLLFVPSLIILKNNGKLISCQ